MKPNPHSLAALACAVLLAGCLTQQQLIERRIGQKADVFAALPPESQQRLRAGQLASGDSRDAAWIVYGTPDRVFNKVTSTGTNEVWSYVSQACAGSDDLRPVYRPVRTSRGWFYETQWAPPPRFDTYEYLRIEFEGDRVLSVQTEAQDP